MYKSSGCFLLSDDTIGIALLPGIDGTGIFFEPLIHVLPEDIPLSVITYPPNRILSLEGHARFVGEHLPKEDVIVVAESFSGLVGLELLHARLPAIKGIIFSAAFAEPLHRTLIRGLSLIPGIGSMFKKLPVPVIDHFLFGNFSSKDLAALLERGLPQIDAKCLEHRADIIARGYPRLDERFDIPCLYLKAARDRLVPHAAASWFAAHFNQFACVEFDAPHCLLQTIPTECAAEIMRFYNVVRDSHLPGISKE